MSASPERKLLPVAQASGAVEEIIWLRKSGSLRNLPHPRLFLLLLRKNGGCFSVSLVNGFSGETVAWLADAAEHMITMEV